MRSKFFPFSVDPFQKGLGVQESNQEVTKVITPVIMEEILPCVSSSLKCSVPYTVKPSRKHTYRYNFDPLKPHFYIVKLGFTGVYIIFLISAQKHRGGSNEYPQSMF